MQICTATAVAYWTAHSTGPSPCRPFNDFASLEVGIGPDRANSEGHPSRTGKTFAIVTRGRVGTGRVIQAKEQGFWLRDVCWRTCTSGTTLLCF